MITSNDLLAPLRERESEPAFQSAAGKQPYRAFEVSSQEKRYLEIRLREPEPGESPSYAMLAHIRAEWRSAQAITLEYGIPKMTMMVIIRGEKLTEVYRALKDWKVEWIAEFSPEEHEPPADDAAPFIRSITIHTTRPEQSPPADKRH